jgi:hypothetical protein
MKTYLTGDDIHDPEVVRAKGIDALAQVLGPVGMAAFMRLYEPGEGDCAASRDIRQAGICYGTYEELRAALDRDKEA